MEVGLGLTAMTKVVETSKSLLRRHTYKPIPVRPWALNLLLKTNIVAPKVIDSPISSPNVGSPQRSSEDLAYSLHARLKS